MSYRPRLDPNEVKAHLNGHKRQPFLDLLGLVMDTHPSPEALKAIAEKNPDRWAQMLAIIARLGGYNEKLEVEGSIITKAAHMSDAELELLITAKLAETQGGKDAGDTQ